MLRKSISGHRVAARAKNSLGSAVGIPTYSTVSSVKRNTLFDLKKKFAERKPLKLVTSYSAYESALIERSEAIDAILVGDSCGMVIAGHKDTTPVTMDEMIYHCKAATSTVKKLFVIGDMPFGSYEATDEDAIRNAIALVKTGRVDAVKLEGGRRMAKRIEAITNAGISVMGHIGLTPQSQSALGGFRVQGRTCEAAIQVIEDAKALEKAGCFAIVLECVPENVAEAVTSAVRIPTIGIGAGNKTSGQILVFHDMFGLFSEFQPKFTKTFRNVGAEITMGLRDFAGEVTAKTFPAAEHSYRMLEGEDEKFRSYLNSNSHQGTLTTKSNSRKRKIAVVGGGAMGSFFASRLAERTENDVWIVSSWKDHIASINAHGMELLSAVALDPPRRIRSLRATAFPEEVVSHFGGPVDLALIMVKSGQTAAAAEKAAVLLGSSQNSFALTLQNGLGNIDILASRLGAHRVLQGITSHGAIVPSPGVVQHTGSGFLTLASPSSVHIPSNQPFNADVLSVMRTSAESAARLFSDAGLPAECASNSIESLVWGKLIINSVINPLTAIMGVRNGELLESSDALFVIRKGVEEACAVARARGIEIPWPNPFNAVLEVLHQTSCNKSSMLQDVIRGEKTEIEAINGAIVKEGKRVGIDAFVNQAIMSCILTEPKPSSLTHLVRMISGVEPNVTRDA